MAKITIDTKYWTTPQKYASEIGVTVQTVVNWIKRGKIEYWHISELGINLVNRYSESVKKINK